MHWNNKTGNNLCGDSMYFTQSCQHQIFWADDWGKKWNVFCSVARGMRCCHVALSAWACSPTVCSHPSPTPACVRPTSEPNWKLRPSWSPCEAAGRAHVPVVCPRSDALQTIGQERHICSSFAWRLNVCTFTHNACSQPLLKKKRKGCLSPRSRLPCAPLIRAQSKTGDLIRSASSPTSDDKP